MKYIPLIVFAIVFLFGIFGALIQFEGESLIGLVFKEQSIRIFAFPKYAGALEHIKKISGVEIRHEFNDFISADARFESLLQLRNFAVLEEAPVFQILAKKSSEMPCFPSEQIPWNIKKVNGGKGGEGINVAVLDTGVAKHPDLVVGLCMDFTKAGIENTCVDKNGHGTHLAGIVSAYGGKKGDGIVGVAPGANLQIIKVCNDEGACFADDVLAGINFAKAQNSNIVLMSFGMQSRLKLFSNFFEENKNILFVGASGEKSGMMFPASNKNVISVQAVNENGDALNYLEDADFVAPGANVESTSKNGCYAKMTGSSVAAAHVAGIAAVLWNENAVKTEQLMKDKAVFAKFAGRKLAVI